MPYDQSLAGRIDTLLKTNNIPVSHSGNKGFTRKEMFGGIGYLYNGNMCVGVYKNDLIIRYDPKQAKEVSMNKHVKPFDITGRPMKGWSLVSGEGLTGEQLNKWFDLAFNFTKSLPAKK